MIYALQQEIHINNIKNSARTSKWTQRLNITEISWIILFRYMSGVHYENRKKVVNIICGQRKDLIITIKADGINSYHCALKG